MSFDNPSDAEMGVCHPNGREKSDTPCGDCQRSFHGEPDGNRVWCIYCTRNPDLDPDREDAVDNFKESECVTCTKRSRQNCRICAEYK